MGRSEATKFSTMKASIILCLLLKLSKAIGEDVVNNIDDEEIHGTGLLNPPDDEKVDEASEQYFNHFRSLRSSVPDNEEIHGTGLLEPSEDEKVDDASEQYFNHFRSMRSSVPASYSSVEKGLVSPVKDQRSCGSCAAFSSIAAIETCFKKKVGVFGDYSEQQLLDCGYNPERGAKGCQGATAHAYLKWAVENNVRLAHESQYPYKNARNQCPNNLPIYNQGVRISNYEYTYNGDEDMLKKMVYEHGAVVATVKSKGPFARYRGGIFSGCPESSSYDHGVTVVGYGTENGTPYWLIKNSWGTGWGENGFIRMKRGVNMCGIGRVIAVAKCETVAGPTDPPLTTAIPCVDKYSNCAQYKKLCSRNYQVKHGCRRTCNTC